MHKRSVGKNKCFIVPGGILLQVCGRNDEDEGMEGLLDRLEISMLRTYENNT